VPVFALAQTQRELPQPLPVDQDHRKDRAGLDRDIEQVTAMAEPALGDQQMAGAGNRQEFGDAFNDAEQQGRGEVGHGEPGVGSGE